MGRNLVQELRELGSEPGGVNTLCTRLRRMATDSKCVGAVSGCHKCMREVIDVLADRIEAEYDPKPEPDTLEKVAKEAVICLASSHGAGFVPTAQEVDGFHKRLEALGVTFDD